MERLPREIFDHIIDQMSIEGSQFASSPKPRLVSFETGFSLETLKALRLCNKKLAEWTACHLFKETVLYFTAKSYDKMVKIAEHPIHRHHVRYLKIAPRSVLRQLPVHPDSEHDEVSFRFSLHSIRATYKARIEQSSAQGEREPAPEGPRSLFGISFQGSPEILSDESPFLQEADRLFDHYSMEYKKQSELSDGNADNRLAFALGQFSQLKRVEPGRYWYWINQGDDSPLGTDDRVALWWAFSDIDPKFTECELAYLLVAIGHGVRTSGVKLELSHLLRGIHTLVLQRVESEEPAIHCQLLSSTTSFHLDFSYNYGWFSLPGNGYATLNASDSKVLKALTGVENLHLKFPFRALSSPLVLDEWKWPRLQYLSLRDLTVRLHDLSAMLQRHKATLRTVQLLEIFVADGDWFEVLSGLRGSALKKIQICRVDEDATTESLGDEWLPSTHPLCEYISGDRSWSKLVEEDVNRRCFMPTPGGFEGYKEKRKEIIQYAGWIYASRGE